MDFGLKGKIALVTGAARGVGREIALSLAAEGANVAVNYRNSGKEAESLVSEIVAKGGKAKAFETDVADFSAVKTMMDEIVKEFGGLNILINNAGVARRQRFTETKPEDWHRQIDACLYGAIHCCYAAAPHLDAAKNGRIVSCHLRAEPMRDANDWLNRYQRFWTEKLDQLAAFLEEDSWPPNQASPSSADSMRRRKKSSARGRTLKR